VFDCPCLCVPQVASRWVFVTVGIIYMCIGILGKVSAIFIMIPEPVLGGALLSITAVFIGKAWAGLKAWLSVIQHTCKHVYVC